MRSLEHLDAYNLARELSVEIYTLTRARPLVQHRILADQMARAAVSIPANIAEAYALGTERQFVRGIRIAFGSATELRTHFWIADRAGALPAQATKDLGVKLDRVTAMLVGLLKRYGARVGDPASG
jgi:four helix bundle protein